MASPVGSSDSLASTVDFNAHSTAVNLRIDDDGSYPTQGGHEQAEVSPSRIPMETSVEMYVDSASDVNPSTHHNLTVASPTPSVASLDSEAARSASSWVELLPDNLVEVPQPYVKCWGCDHDYHITHAEAHATTPYEAHSLPTVPALIPVQSENVDATTEAQVETEATPWTPPDFGRHPENESEDTSMESAERCEPEEEVTGAEQNSPPPNIEAPSSMNVPMDVTSPEGDGTPPMVTAADIPLAVAAASAKMDKLDPDVRPKSGSRGLTPIEDGGVGAQLVVSLLLPRGLDRFSCRFCQQGKSKGRAPKGGNYRFPDCVSLLHHMARYHLGEKAAYPGRVQLSMEPR
eukprot:3424941-Amphidinium_carterae.4